MKMTETIAWAASTRVVRLLWIGRTAVWVADQIAEIAVIWFTWTLTNSSVMVGLVALVARSPFWLIGWAAGLVADRYRPDKLLLWTNSIGVFIALALPLLYRLDMLTFPVLVLLAFLLSCLRTLEMPALVAMVPAAVPADQIRPLNSVLDNAKRFGRLAGQSAASALQALLPVPLLFIFVAAGLALMASIARHLPSKAAISNAPRRTVPADLRQGWDALAADRPLVLVVACFALYNLAYATGYFVLLPRLFGSDLEGGGSLYGIAVAAFGLGGLASNLLMGGARGHGEKSIFAAFLWFGFWFALLAVEPPTPLALLFVHLAGWAIPSMDIGTASMINERIAAGNQGKVFTFFRYLAELGMAGGLLIGGSVVQALGSRGALVTMLAYLVVLVGCFWFLLARAQRRSVMLKEPG
jgi:MFS transporter, DHA3 family, macrolide efflux protein